MLNDRSQTQRTGNWAFNHLALALTVVLIVLIALFCIWYFGKHPGNSQPDPGESNPGPKHTQIVAPQLLASVSPEHIGNCIISVD